MTLDYKSIGLKVGLEIHVQLDTKHKLFCHCPTSLVEKDETDIFERELRPARSELGEVDAAALLEWKKRKRYQYHAPRTASCLVEADEEPPHELNREALTIALAVAKAMNMWIVDEVHVMRKIVIDGSNTTGFQRTSIIALNGYIMDGEKRIGIQTLCLEEDAARKLGEDKTRIQYKLDRLGIPLVEIATAPDISSPEQAERVAFKIGQLVRLTGRAKRGLGTIRQDLNISIKGGAKTEIKGVQHLYLIPNVVEYEALRQVRLLEIRDELLRRGLKQEDITGEIYDVTGVFKDTKSKIIRRVISRKNHGVYAVILPGFKGLLGREVQPKRRFGTELADYARVWGGVGGIFHTDELPAYGISREEIDQLYEVLGADKDRDAIVLVADHHDKAVEALNAVVDRAREALNGVPEETRASQPDGTTRYMRPRPGSARMYPETDIPPVEITEELLNEAEKLVPEPPDVKLRRFTEEYGLSKPLAEAVLNDLRLDLFEKLAETYKDKVHPRIIASILTNTLKMLRGERIPVENITDEHIEIVVKMLAEGRIAKEAIPEILRYVAEHPNENMEAAARKLGLTIIPVNVLDKLIEEAIRNNMEKIKARPDKAFSIIMGTVMSKVRGRIDGRIVAEKVKDKIKNILEAGP